MAIGHVLLSGIDGILARLVRIRGNRPRGQLLLQLLIGHFLLFQQLANQIAVRKHGFELVFHLDQLEPQGGQRDFGGQICLMLAIGAIVPIVIVRMGMVVCIARIARIGRGRISGWNGGSGRGRGSGGGGIVNKRLEQRLGGVFSRLQRQGKMHIIKGSCIGENEISFVVVGWIGGGLLLVLRFAPEQAKLTPGQ